MPTAPLSAIKQSLKNVLSRERALALLLIVLFFSVFFGPTLLSGKFLVCGDAFYQSYPLRSIAWSAITHGQLPLWTPLVFSGYPLLSMAQVAIGYPLTWLYLFLPGYQVEQMIALAPFLLAPAFTYAYARELGRSHLAALIAGLAFTYGGNMSSKLGGLGLMANPEMWLPLFLLFIERARRKSLIGCLLGATGTYTMSVFAGQAQAFLLVGLVASAYAIFLTITKPAIGPAPPHERTSSRWRPVVVAFGGILLTIGITAFQILETFTAVRHSVRSTLSYQVFTVGAFSPVEAFRSFIAPVYHYIEVSTYVAPIVTLLALYSLEGLKKGGRVRVHILFWTGTAVVAALLMLGDHTPLYQLLYRVPILNLFRYPSRHAFEWTLALSILGAFGFDFLSDSAKRHLNAATQPRTIATACVSFVAAAVVAVLWWRDAFARPLASNFGLDSGLIPSLPESHYLIWKLCFSGLIVLSVWFALKTKAAAARQALLTGALALALFIEPQVLLAHVWFPYARTKAEFTETPLVERWLQQHTSDRIYTRMNLFVQGYWQPPAVDLPNMTAVRGLENVAGYEQLILERYSRALGNVGPDGVNLRYGLNGPPDDSLLGERSRVLDLLNTRYLVSFSDFATAPTASMTKDGIRFAKDELGTDLQPGQTLTLNAANATGDTLMLVTSLANSVDISQDQPVASVLVRTTDGHNIQAELKAGRDTAEWAHERTDVRAAVKHQLAPLFDQTTTGSANEPALRFLTRTALPPSTSIREITIENVSQHAQLAVWKATLYDSRQQQSAPLTISKASTNKFAPVFRSGDTIVWENKNVLPRAWLVSQAEAVSTEEALHRVRGEGGATFDPRRTALLEVGPSELPPLDGNDLGSETAVKISSYESNHIAVETTAPAASVLVLSEIFYLGWRATVDGQPAQILKTDYLLRGVALSKGAHRIEMRYFPTGARLGAYVSGLSLLLVAGLFVYRRSGLLHRRR